MRTTPTVRFRSKIFKPLRPEEEQVNPGVYGEELACWLSEHLTDTAGIKPRVDFEDFAWLVELPFGDGTAWLFCTNEYGSDELWMIDVREAPRLLGWLRRPKLQPEVLFELCSTVHAILGAEPSISEIEWVATGKRGQEEEASETPRR
jgi:hypothetical protein